MISFIASIKKKFLSSRNFSSNKYWSKRYLGGGNSGPGSYGHLAIFKANVLNRFVSENSIDSIIEFGCGDGNQLALANYPKYTGYDISTEAIKMCRERFSRDDSKKFSLANSYNGEQADLALSLDVIFHLTEEEVFEIYMRRLFDAAKKFVVIYSSNQTEPIEPTSKHVRHRRFSEWVEHELPEWELVKTIPNAYPYNGDNKQTSFADFFVYAKL